MCRFASRAVTSTRSWERRVPARPPSCERSWGWRSLTRARLGSWASAAGPGAYRVFERVGFLPADPPVRRGLSVRRDVETSLSLAGVRDPEAARRALALVGIDDLAERARALAERRRPSSARHRTGDRPQPRAAGARRAHARSWRRGAPSHPRPASHALGGARDHDDRGHARRRRRRRAGLARRRDARRQPRRRVRPRGTSRTRARARRGGRLRPAARRARARGAARP